MVGYYSISTALPVRSCHQMTNMNYIKKGSGKPLLLIHGLGGSIRSWDIISEGLTKEREVVIVDLSGFGETPAMERKVNIANLADAVNGFLKSQKL